MSGCLNDPAKLRLSPAPLADSDGRSCRGGSVNAAQTVSCAAAVAPEFESGEWPVGVKALVPQGREKPLPIPAHPWQKPGNNLWGHMIHRLYTWTLSLAEHPRALWALAIVAFIESSFFPIPPDIMLIPMILAARSQAFRIALVAVVASVAGGLFGYAIGAFAFESIGQPILASLGKESSMAAFNDKFNAYGTWAVLVAGVTPFPFKVITIMSGWTGMALVPFVLSALVARALRFFAFALLLYYFGPPIRRFIERHLGLVFTAFVLILGAGFFAVRYL
jgi:membrane protein YqaA with SNARE-associated domain